MKLQTQPNAWSCLPTAFAMVLNTPIEKIIGLIGHDGSEIRYPNLQEPMKRRSFHIQEMINVCYMLGYWVTPIEALPYSAAFAETPFLVIQGNEASKRLKFYLLRHSGIIITGNKQHALAWDNVEKSVYNPVGSIQAIESVSIKEFWLVGKQNG